MSLRLSSALAFLPAVVFGLQAEAASLRVAVPNPIEQTDPVKMLVAQEAFVLPLIYEQLFSGDSAGNITSELAESWTFDAKKSRLDVRLRPGHRFSDGTEVTAADVVRSLTRFCDPRYRTSSRLVGLEGCGTGNQLAVRAADDRTVSFSVKMHPAAFIYQLAFGALGVFRETPDGRWIGSGPFRVEKLEKGKLTLSANPHHAKAKTPSADSLELEYVPEHELAGKIASNAVDVASMYIYSSLNQVNSDSYRVYKHSPQVTQTLVLNPGLPPFTNQALRRALADEVSRSSVAACRPGEIKAEGLIPRGIGGSLSSEDEPSASAKAAENSAALAARPRSPVTVKIYRSLERASKCEEDALGGAFAKWNIRLEFVHLASYAELIPKYLDKTTSGYIEYFVFTSRDAASVFKKFLPGNREPYFFYTSAAYARKLNQALAEGNIAKRFTVYRELNRDVREHASVIPLYYVPHANVVRKELVDEDFSATLFNPNSFIFLLQIDPKRLRP